MAVAHSSDARPTCRVVTTDLQVLHVSDELPVSVTLNNIIAKAFPEEHAERARESTGADTAAGPPPVPLFVMSCMLPGGRWPQPLYWWGGACC